MASHMRFAAKSLLPLNRVSFRCWISSTNEGSTIAWKSLVSPPSKFARSSRMLFAVEAVLAAVTELLINQGGFKYIWSSLPARSNSI